MLVPFIEEIARFWTTGDREPLQDYIPTNTYQGLDINNKTYDPLHRILAGLAGGKGGIEEAFALDREALKQRLLGFTLKWEECSSLTPISFRRISQDF